MARLLSLKPSCLHVKLPPVKWMHFTMHESQFLDLGDYRIAWSYTWKAILLASGVPHDGSTEPARFLLSKHDDHALAVLIRTTMLAKDVEKMDIVSCVTGKSMFHWVSIWADDEAIEIVYPSQLSMEEAVKFSVRGKPLEVVECEVKEHENIEDGVDKETED